MKLIYVTVLCVVACLLPAKAANIVLNIDDPSRVSVEVNYEPYTNLVAGDNFIEGSFYVSISATPGNSLVSVDWENGYYDLPVENNKASFGTFNDGAKYYVITKSNAESQTAILKIDVDKASAVRASFTDSSRMITLTDGLNEISYDPEIDHEVKIYSSVSAQMPLYSVTIVDGTGELSETGNVYFVTLPCEGTVKVISQFPAEDAQIDLSFTEGCEGFLTKVTLDTPDGEEVPVVDGGFAVNVGSVVYLHGDMENYQLYTYSVNEQEVTFSNPQRLIVVDSYYALDFYVEPFPEFNISITIDNPEAIVARYGSNLYPGSEFALTAGENTVTLNSNKNSILLTPVNTDTYKVESVTLNGEEIESNYAGRYQISDLVSGDQIVINTVELVRDIHAVIYVDNEAENLWSLETSSGKNIPLQTGYNHIMVATEENPFKFCDGYGLPYIFVNDEPVAATGSGFFKEYYFNITQDAVVKLFVDVDAEPEFYTVNFTQSAFDKVEVLADQITPITQYAGYEVLEQTEIQIKAKEGYTLTAKVNGEELSSVGGLFTFVVEGNTNVELTASNSGVGVESITANDGRVKGVRPDGIVIEAESINELPAGFYIIEGRKIVVR